MEWRGKDEADDWKQSLNIALQAACGMFICAGTFYLN
jgi:hypothetical protein